MSFFRVASWLVTSVSELGVWATIRNGLGEPGPNASDCSFHAWYWLESSGDRLVSRGPRRKSPMNTGRAATTSTRMPAITEAPAWRVTKRLQRMPRRRDSSSGTFSATGVRAWVMRDPTAARIAGSSVVAASITQTTKITTA